MDGRPNRGNDNGNYKERGGHLNQNKYSIKIFFLEKKILCSRSKKKRFSL